MPELKLLDSVSSLTSLTASDPVHDEVENKAPEAPDHVSSRNSPDHVSSRNSPNSSIRLTRKASVPYDSYENSPGKFDWASLYGSSGFLAVVNACMFGTLVVTSFVSCLTAYDTSSGSQDVFREKDIIVLASLANSLSKEAFEYQKPLHGLPIDQVLLSEYQLSTDRMLHQLRSAGVASGEPLMTDEWLTNLRYTAGRGDAPVFVLKECLAKMMSLAGQVMRLTAELKRAGDLDVLDLAQFLAHEAATVNTMQRSLLHFTPASPAASFDFLSSVYRQRASADLLEPLLSLAGAQTRLATPSGVPLQTLSKQLADNALATLLPYAGWATVARSFSSPWLYSQAAQVAGESSIVSASLAAEALAALSESDRHRQKAGALWLMTGLALVAFSLLVSHLILTYRKRTHDEERIMRDFGSPDDTARMIGNYCKRIENWDLDLDLALCKADSQMELQLCTAVNALRIIKPFVPMWVFTLREPKDKVDAFTPPLAGGDTKVKIDAMEAAAAELQFNFTDFSADESGLSRKRSTSIASASSDYSCDQSVDMEEPAGAVQLVDLEIGLTMQEMTLVLIDLRIVNAQAFHNPAYRSPQLVEAAMAFFMRTIVGAAKKYRGTVLTTSPISVVIGFKQETNLGDKESRACRCARAIVMAYDTEVIRLREAERCGGDMCTLEEVLGTPEAGHPSIGIHTGKVAAGIVSTGTFKTYLISGKEMRRLLQLERLNSVLRTRILLSSSVVFAIRDTKNLRHQDVGILKTDVVAELQQAKRTKREKEQQRNLRLFFKMFKSQRYREAIDALREFITQSDGGRIGAGQAVETKTPHVKYLWDAMHSHFGEETLNDTNAAYNFM
eukprot:gene19397-29881_t